MPQFQLQIFSWMVIALGLAPTATSWAGNRKRGPRENFARALSKQPKNWSLGQRITVLHLGTDKLKGKILGTDERSLFTASVVGNPPIFYEFQRIPNKGRTEIQEQLIAAAKKGSALGEWEVEKLTINPADVGEPTEFTKVDQARLAVQNKKIRWNLHKLRRQTINPHIASAARLFLALAKPSVEVAQSLPDQGPLALIEQASLLMKVMDDRRLYGWLFDGDVNLSKQALALFWKASGQMSDEAIAQALSVPETTLREWWNLWDPPALPTQNKAQVILSTTPNYNSNSRKTAPSISAIRKPL